MSIEARYYSLQDLKSQKGFDQNAMMYAEKARCPFYSFLTYTSKKDADVEYIICQVFTLDKGTLKPTLSQSFEEKIPCFIISAENIAKLASKTFNSHPVFLADALPFDLVQALTFAGPYQYGFKDTIPNWEQHFQNNPSCLNHGCNVCNYQHHAITVLPDILSELEPEKDYLHTELSMLVDACLKNEGLVGSVN